MSSSSGEFYRQRPVKLINNSRINGPFIQSYEGRSGVEGGEGGSRRELAPIDGN